MLPKLRSYLDTLTAALADKGVHAREAEKRIDRAAMRTASPAHRFSADPLEGGDSLGRRHDRHDGGADIAREGGRLAGNHNLQAAIAVAAAGKFVRNDGVSAGVNSHRLSVTRLARFVRPIADVCKGRETLTYFCPFS